MTIHNFILIYPATPQGQQAARRAVNRWYMDPTMLGVITAEMWSAFYDRIAVTPARRDENIAQVAIVDKEDADD